MVAAPILYTPEVENYKDDEDKTIEGLNETFDTILETTSADYGHAVRAVHAKAHGVLRGELEVLPNLSTELAQGLFATPGRHKVFLRLSTNAGDILPDVIGLPRGLAFKVLDVDGERLAGAEGSAQDFVMVNGQAFQAKTADMFLANLKLLAKTTGKMEGAKKAMSATLGVINKGLKAVGVESPAVTSLGGAPNVDPLGECYFSVTPFRYGDYIAKFRIAPLSQNLKALEGKEIDAHDRPDAIRETVKSEMAALNGVWEFGVQLCRDLDAQPIEDPTKPWKTDDAPFETVARLTVNAQDSWAPDQVQAIDEAMRFSVWTGLQAHQPLGNINRARRDTYNRSAAFRQDFNRCPIHEPSAAAD